MLTRDTSPLLPPFPSLSSSHTLPKRLYSTCEDNQNIPVTPPQPDITEHRSHTQTFFYKLITCVNSSVAAAAFVLHYSSRYLLLLIRLFYFPYYSQFIMLPPFCYLITRQIPIFGFYTLRAPLLYSTRLTVYSPPQATGTYDPIAHLHYSMVFL